MRSAAVFLSSTLAAGAYASTVLTSHQCVLDPGPSSPHATCLSLSPTIIPFDRYEEHQYSEIALHYLDGTKNVISATGYTPRCTFEASGRSPVSSPRAQDARPYKATWIRIRYAVPSLSESPCAQVTISESINSIAVQAVSTDTPGGIEAGTTSSHGVNEIDHEERPVKQLGTSIPSEDTDYVPIRRRATFGELCQLLVLFMVLGALHRISARFAARWQAPPPVETRSPQCE